MISRYEGGPDTIDNAIPVCFECHAEIHAYNDQHPRGRKYRPEELRLHKQQWLDMCKQGGVFLASIPSRTDVGPIQALIDELEFNQAIAARAPEVPHLLTSAHFALTQFDRCISEGVLSLLELDLKERLINAYAAMRRANNQIDAIAPARSGEAQALAVNRTRDRLNETLPLIQEALARLRQVLAPEGD